MPTEPSQSGLLQVWKLFEAIPESVQARLAGRRFTVALPRQVVYRLRSPEKVSGSEWAEKYRVVSGGAHDGPWRNEYVPHARKILDTFTAPHVREVWFAGVEQSGKTNTMLSCMGWAIDCDPGNIYYLMPTEDTAQKVTDKRIRPTIHLSPRLARYLSRRADDNGLAKINLSHGVTIFPSWANSPSSMATFSAKHCFADETDKYPALSGRETDPITLIKRRNRTYKGRYKRFFTSTPGGGRFIVKGVAGCHQEWHWRVRCQDCGEFVTMDADHLVIPDGVTGADDVDLSGVRYACNACGLLWDEEAHKHAIRGGAWFCVRGADVPLPSKVGFRHRAWECLDVPLEEIAAAHLRNKSGDLADKIAYANGIEATDYVAEHGERAEEQVLRLVDQSMPRCVVPRDPSCLLIVADTQQRGFYYQVFAYGWGSDLEMWCVDHGYVEEFSHLVDLAARDLRDADGQVYRPASGFIDSGGGANPYRPKHSRTMEVYEFCKLHPFWKPVKGSGDRQVQPWISSKIDFYPSRDGKKIPIPGGLVLYRLAVKLYKDRLASKLNIEPGGPGALHLHAEVAGDYARQMCAEYQDERGVWQCLAGRPNHHWDIGVYGIAAADILQIRTLRRSGAVPARKILSRGVQQ